MSSAAAPSQVQKSKKSVVFADQPKIVPIPSAQTNGRYRPSGYVDYSTGKPIYVYRDKVDSNATDLLVAKIKTMAEPYELSDAALNSL
jgi:hypothetical protein